MQQTLSLFPLIIWRDSVCAGDDGDAPHEWTLNIPRDMSLRDFARAVSEAHYLASIRGGQATWILEAARPVAVLAQQWSEPRWLVAPDSPVLSLIGGASRPHLNFRYRAQSDPDQAFADLLRGAPSPASGH